MFLIILIFALSGLKFAEIWRFGEVSWWHIAGLALVAFLWFEFFEKMLGLDKKKAVNEDEVRRKKRVKDAFDKSKK
ncbi:TIGR04438 family Trp-rich protein [Massilia glaciei]|uniref:TIGR04438 family Trp-rich protein n=1 Tax=Massilia glaciei TaxID=1524097 RepID=A0A2U2HJB7_9BURK|nr:TIGR04438 family Trp-rich protein [Massilia glaciei]PWF46781.1 TIGR04438 family Trp-rich protein [Massilia glaciei]